MVLLNRADVFLSADFIDVTDEAIARIDSGFSSGEVVEDGETAPTPERVTPPTPESVSGE